MTIVLGSWTVPLVLTLIFFGRARFRTDKVPNTGFMGNAIEGMLNYGFALIASLVVWLIWALVR